MTTVASGTARDIEVLRQQARMAADVVRVNVDGLTSETLDRTAPFSPSGDPNETVRSLLTAISWHQAYHAGQMEILRRIAGKDGAIR